MRYKGINLRDLADKIPAPDAKDGFGRLQAQPDMAPKAPDHKSTRGVENVFLAAAHGDKAVAVSLLNSLQRRMGVTRVVHSSDRARQEFSNGTNLLHLSRHVDNYGVPGEWVFSTPNEGKGPNDALGFAVTKILHERVARGARCPDYVAAAAILRKHTQGKPIRGKYSVYQQYVFMTVDPLM